MYMYLWMQTSYAKQSSDILELLGVDIPRKKKFLTIEYIGYAVANT